MLYLGGDAVPHAAPSVERARAAGMTMAFVTNNASRAAGSVAAHLSELGIPATARDVVTSGQAIAHWLTRQLPKGSAVLVLGTPELQEQIAEAGFAPQRTAEGALAVVQGLDPSTSWKDLAEASVAILAGALWVAGNRDSTYPTSRGALPGNGAMVQALVTATGLEPVVVGKPEPELHLTSVERVGAKRPLVVGDRLDTDVLGAVRAGADSLLVLTGVTDREQLLAAPPDRRPTYIASDLRGLVACHEQPVVDGDRATCGDEKAWYDEGQLQVSGPSDDALRAACALAWFS